MGMDSQLHAPLTVAEALKEEFVQLHGPLPDYHAWLSQLPVEPKIWRFGKGHFKDLHPLLTSAFGDVKSPLRGVFSAETLQSFEGCRRSRSFCDSLFQLLADDLNRLLTGGSSLLERAEFAQVTLTAATRQLAATLPKGARLEILNRLVLEETFPGAIAQVWDTLPGIYSLIHTRTRTAVCLSGGGIRSATFGLGVLQGLARHDLLGQFDYLSTVSGGGYIGSWLSSWIHHAGSSAQVFEALKSESVRSPTEPEPETVEHLRRFSNYLTPRLGSLSADTWTLIGTYLRNLVLNWVVFLPVILAVLALPRLWVSLLRLPAEPASLTILATVGFLFGGWGIAYGAMQRPNVAAELQARSPFWARRGDQSSFLKFCLLPLAIAAACFTTFWAWLPSLTFELPPWWCFAVGGAFLHWCGWILSVVVIRRAGAMEAGAVLFTGAVGGLMLWVPAQATFSNLLTAPDLEIYVCFAAPVFLLVFLLTATLFIGLASRRTSDADREWWSRMGAWLLLGLIAWAAFSSIVLFGPLGLVALPPLWSALGGLPGLFVVLAGYSNRTPPDREEASEAGWSTRMYNWGLAVAAPLFIVFVAAAFSQLTTAMVSELQGFERLDHLTVVHQSNPWAVLLVMVAAASLSYIMSLCIDINRFSLHSIYRNRLIRAYLGASNPRRDPNAFTGFDPRDNLRLHQLTGQRPFHIVNMALNLVSDDNLAWQQRKAESFTASPLHAGSFRLGYRASRDYAQNERRHGLSLGTAITISGAAASPNQGYHSSPTIALLMTLFNVRLGAWLGNPGPAGNEAFRESAPGNPAIHVLKEAFGLTDNDSPFVYLSDGGHFENLGLYEMVLRRCHFIVVSDAGCDPKCSLEDLGNAIRKIRVDLGVPIDLPRFSVFSREAGAPVNRHCAVGEIHYDRVDGPSARRGLLIYIKPSITGDEPRDVFNYAQTCPEFPHETTGDQWFSESQFESYRMLGLHSVTEMCQDWERTCGHHEEKSLLAVFARQSFKYLEIPFPPDLESKLSLPPRRGGLTAASAPAASDPASVSP